MQRLIEDYLRTTLELERKGLKVGPLDPEFAQELGVDAQKAATALEALKERSLAECGAQGWIRLTVKGRTQAEEVLRKHETIEGFFEEVLGVEEAHTEAHALEHVISHPVLEMMGRLRSQRNAAIPLSRTEEGQTFDIVHLDLSDQRTLDRAIGVGLLPSQDVRTLRRGNGFLVLEVQGKKIALDKGIGDHIYGVIR